MLYLYHCKTVLSTRNNSKDCRHEWDSKDPICPKTLDQTTQYLSRNPIPNTKYNALMIPYINFPIAIPWISSNSHLFEGHKFGIGFQFM